MTRIYPQLLFAPLLILLLNAAASANSAGAPVCEVPFIPFTPMSSTIGSPTPANWRVETSARWYRAGESIEIRIRNDDPLKFVRGVLLWAKFESDFSPAGSFLVGPGSLWRHIPPSPTAQCAQGSITHNSATVKTQSDMVFSWTAPAQGDVFIRAYVIEDCLLSSCRSFQALTELVALPEAFLVTSFE